MPSRLPAANLSGSMKACCAIVVAAGVSFTLTGCGPGTTTPPPTTTEAPASNTTTTPADILIPIQPQTIHFRAHPSWCIEAVDADASSGSAIRLAMCDDQALHQSWLFDANSSNIRSAVDSSKCLDISDGNVEVGTYLQIWDCYFGDAQTWGYDEEPGRVYHCADGDCDTSFCIDVPQSVIGSPVEIWTCDDKVMQSWSLGPSSFPPVPVPAPPPPAPPTPPGKPFQSNATSQCVDLPGGDASNGALLWMWDCYDGESQQWFFQNGTLVYKADTSKCVDLLDNNSTNGNVLGIWDCNGGDSQQWVFDSHKGTLSLASSAASNASNASKCVQIGGENDGDPLIIWDCNGKQNQTWTIGSALDALFSFAVV